MGFPLPETGSVTEDSGVVGGFLTTSGDADFGPFFNLPDTWVAQTIAGAYGSQLVIAADGSWTYTADNSNAAIQALDSGGTLSEVFTITAQNGNTTTVTITINGTDEPPCFARGTWIDTPQGPQLIETLQAGDEVITHDDGVQQIRWIGSHATPLDYSLESEKLRPIRLRAGCLGPGLPTRDLLVSPMHRILIGGSTPSLLFGQDEVLCAAKHLVNGHTIFADMVPEVEYFHLLFDDHQIVTSNGCLSESFYPGTIGLSGFAQETRDEVLTLFPDLRALPESYGKSARSVLRQHEAFLVREALCPQDQLLTNLRRRAA